MISGRSLACQPAKMSSQMYCQCTCSKELAIKTKYTYNSSKPEDKTELVHAPWSTQTQTVSSPPRRYARSLCAACRHPPRAALRWCGPPLSARSPAARARGRLARRSRHLRLARRRPGRRRRGPGALRAPRRARRGRGELRALHVLLLERRARARARVRLRLRGRGRGGRLALPLGISRGGRGFRLGLSRA